MRNSENKIALMRPRLPSCDLIYPYLKEIDANRWYSNFGPLTLGLEDKIADAFKMEQGSVVTVSNGTAGLTNILRSLDLPRGSHCLLPSWTFMATPASLVSAGYIPYFIDVDEETWALDPHTVRKYIRKFGNKTSAIMVVSPFGSPLDVEAWDMLSEETGVPVIIDAAAGYDAFTTVESSRPRKSPVMISLHATKALATGEGGIVVSTNKDLVRHVRHMSNFGFNASRVISIPGTNGKMSEYHAAVGHAALEDWPQKRAKFYHLKTQYIKAIEKARLPVKSPGLKGDWVSSTLSVRLPSPNANPVIEQLNNAGIESRQWWGSGCHTHPAYMMHPRAELPVTEKLGGSVIALPFTVDMAEQDVEYIVSTLSEIIHKTDFAQQSYG